MEWSVVVAAGVGVALVVSPTWRVARGWVTLVHEVGHALAAVVAEGRVRRIRVELDTSGVTEWTGDAVRRRVPRGFVAWWGYPAPGLTAVGLGVAVRTGHPALGLGVVAVAGLVVTAVWVRNVWGLTLSAVVVAAAVAGALRGGSTSEAVAVGLAALWAVGGVRAAGSAAPRVRRGDGSDQATLAAVLWLPVGFWSATMVAMAAATTLATALLVAPALTA